MREEVFVPPSRGDDSKVPPDLKYTKEHEWVRVRGQEAEVGITDFAQGELGDVVFVELPGWSEAHADEELRDDRMP